MENHARHPSQQEIMNYFLSGSGESSNTTLNDSNHLKKIHSANGSQDFTLNRKSPKLHTYKTHKSNLSTSSLVSNQPSSNKVLGKDHLIPLTILLFQLQRAQMLPLMFIQSQTRITAPFLLQPQLHMDTPLQARVNLCLHYPL